MAEPMVKGRRTEPRKRRVRRASPLGTSSAMARRTGTDPGEPQGTGVSTRGAGVGAPGSVPVGIVLGFRVGLAVLVGVGHALVLGGVELWTPGGGAAGFERQGR